MSGGANRKFISDPKGFLKSNILTPHNSLQAVAKGKSGVVLVNIIADTTGNTCVSASGKKVPIYRATGVTKKPSIRSNAFKAYYLPYAPDAVSRMNLGSEADFFFTDKIDGCTFAIGKGSASAPLVSHANMTTGGRIDQQKIDSLLSTLYGSSGFQPLTLDQYMSPAERRMIQDQKAPVAKTHVTVIGVREARGWQFYYQRRNWLGGTKYRLVDYSQGQ